jgi:hypothetical protein
MSKSKILKANQIASAIFQDARKKAATKDDIKEWQRLYRLTHALDVALAHKEVAST